MEYINSILLLWCSMPKRVAAIVTEYRKWSHADVILRNLLDGYPDGTKPDLQQSPVVRGVDGLRRGFLSRLRHEFQSNAVSYTHLTLPTICSV